MTISSGPDIQPLNGRELAMANFATPNRERGEFAIQLGVETFILHPTADCLQRIESETGKKGSALLQRLIHERSIGIGDLVVVIATGIEAGDVAAPEDLGERIVKQGVIAIMACALAFLTNALILSKDLEAMSAAIRKPSQAGGAGNH